jgi:hypothetical protein
LRCAAPSTERRKLADAASHRTAPIVIANMPHASTAPPRQNPAPMPINIDMALSGWVKAAKV